MGYKVPDVNNCYDFTCVLGQLNQWCCVHAPLVQGVYDQCKATSLSEQVSWLFGVVRDTVKAQQCLDNNFKILYDFVDDFFTNLDLQEEINNKLNQMVEDGTFANQITPLIVQYSTPHFVESTEEMTNHAYIYVLASTGNVWAWNGSEFSDTGVEYIGGVNNLLRNYGTLPDGVDLNTITQNAIYLLSDSNTYTNSALTTGTLLHFNFSTNIAIQIEYSYTYGYNVYRNKTAAGWGEWRNTDLSYYGASLSDADDAKNMSLYIVSSTTNNLPTNETYFLYTYGGTQSGAKMQYATRFSDSRTFVRVYSVAQSKWLEWYENSFLNGSLSYVGFLTTSDNIDDLGQNTIYINDPSSTPNIGLPENGAGYVVTVGSSTVKVQVFVRTSNGRQYVRYLGTGKWSDWINNTSLYMGTTLTDCNVALANSFYVLNPGEVDNLPTEQTGLLFTFGTDSAAKIQFYVLYSSGVVYFRHTITPFTDKNYSAWIKYGDSNGGFKTTAKMFSIGNSILTGSVWVNGSYNHLANYGNAPYSVIADALQLRESNVYHTLLSSTGLLYNAGEGNFLTNIKNTDLSEYDVLLTHLWTRDLDNTFPLGTIDSVADDGSLAGAVVSLINCMKASNGMCQLILVGIPPVSTTIYGENVFTGAYPNGSSISQCNTLMHQLAEKYHFTFVDWEDLNLSYYYQDYTDGSNVHANNENTYRVMGAYLAGKASVGITF